MNQGSDRFPAVSGPLKNGENGENGPPRRSPLFSRYFNGYDRETILPCLSLGANLADSTHTHRALDRVAAAEAENLAPHRRGVDRGVAGQDLDAERIDVGGDVIGEQRPQAVVDHVDADEAPRRLAAFGARLGLEGGGLAEQAFDHLEALLVDRAGRAADAHRLVLAL